MAQNPHNQISEKSDIPVKILEFLKDNKDYVSGEEISRHLNISRQALWEHINGFRDAGYEIAAVPHLGYRMAALPDRLFPFEIEDGLGTRFVGRKVHYLNRCSSTMDIAMQVSGDDPQDGLLIVAESQTRGKGRLGRHWVSTKYKGLYFTLVLKTKVPVDRISLLTFLTAVSVCEAVKTSAGISCSIKWPNDVLINGKKLGGILTELKTGPGKAHFAAIGVGLNVNNDHQELLRGAVSLKAASRDRKKFNRVALLQEILRRIEENYLVFQKKGPSAVLEKWKSWNVTLGRQVRVISSNSHIDGTAADIDSDGGLLVRAGGPGLRKFMSGDILHLR